MPSLHFTKMNGAGNYFVMLDNRDGSLALTDAQISHLPNPRNEAVENDLIVDNRCFIELGLNPTTLDDGLLAEVVDVARRWAYRCYRSRIPCQSAWTQTQAQAIQTA